jgi:hypothetical protein
VSFFPCPRRVASICIVFRRRNTLPFHFFSCLKAGNGEESFFEGLVLGSSAFDCVRPIILHPFYSRCFFPTHSSSIHSFNLGGRACVFQNFSRKKKLNPNLPCCACPLSNSSNVYLYQSLFVKFRGPPWRLCKRLSPQLRILIGNAAHQVTLEIVDHIV